MNKSFLFVIAIVALALMGCGSVEVVVRPNTGFTQASSITVECDGNDWGNLQPRIEQALLKNGFDVISPAVARTKLQSESSQKNQLSNPESQRIPQSSSSESSTQVVREFRSVYLLRYRLDFDEGTSSPLFYRVKNFTASIIDLRTGEVVGTITQDGSLTVSELANDIGNQLSQTVTK
jgi:uncharacterized protein YceK